jgi:hypothetical protein
MGTLLGSVLIPAVSSSLQRETARRELKREKGIAALRTQWELEQNLNMLLTEFEIFYKDKFRSGQATRADREELRGKVATRYAEFGKSAWWWYRQVLEEAVLLSLVSTAESHKLSLAEQEYQRTLVTSAEQVERLWAVMIRAPSLSPPAGFETTVTEVRRKMAELEALRKPLVAQLVSAILQ